MHVEWTKLGVSAKHQILGRQRHQRSRAFRILRHDYHELVAAASLQHPRDSKTAIRITARRFQHKRDRLPDGHLYPSFLEPLEDGIADLSPRRSFVLNQ